MMSTSIGFLLGGIIFLFCSIYTAALLLRR